ncbi:SDR family NAD(P)-dependent oxidoreductase [Massilibacterium senegalense]|uniref:SDR family NAD(P)-dependent oxidoreductase n=1 Tax=Massilibacterium senegalense TaxID=1632858 RepID=UPI000784FE88|nr:SDR family oxidoreductase [Massilibacterium senegalense]
MSILDNQVAIITGAGRGVGRAVAEQVAHAGGKVVVCDLDESVAKEVVTVIEDAGGEAIACIGDITKPTFPKQVVDQAMKTFGQVDIVVNNAGYTWDSMIHKMSDEQFQAMLDIHLITPFRMIREVSAHFRTPREDGTYRKIVNVSSVAGVMGNVGQANYASAKAGLIGLTKTVAREWASFQVNCNAVAFGMIDTRLTQVKENGESVFGISVGIPEKVRTMFEQSIPQKRSGTPKEAADAIFYLLSPFSNYVNGQVLHVNGGWYT